MRLEGEERREFQRLRLDPPIAATLATIPVTILEIGVLGARVRHDQLIGQEFVELHFTSEGDKIAVRCQVVRTWGGGNSSQSGLRFLSVIEDSGEKLRAMLARLVTQEFEVRRNHPPDSFPPVSVDGDRTVRGSDAGFLTYRLENGTWHKRRVFLPEQPAAGFTVARTEDSAEMQRLCRVYEASDEEGRRLIRLFAELSVSDVLEIPPKH